MRDQRKAINKRVLRGSVQSGVCARGQGRRETIKKLCAHPGWPGCCARSYTKDPRRTWQKEELNLQTYSRPTHRSSRRERNLTGLECLWTVLGSCCALQMHRSLHKMNLKVFVKVWKNSERQQQVHITGKQTRSLKFKQVTKNKTNEI